MEARSEVEPTQSPANPLSAESVAPVDIRDVAALSVERPRLELIGKQIEVTSREVKE